MKAAGKTFCRQPESNEKICKIALAFCQVDAQPEEGAWQGLCINKGVFSNCGVGLSAMRSSAL